MFASEFTLIQSPKENNVVLTYLKYGQKKERGKKQIKSTAISISNKRRGIIYLTTNNLNNNNLGLDFCKSSLRTKKVCVRSFFIYRCRKTKIRQKVTKFGT